MDSIQRVQKLHLDEVPALRAVHPDPAQYPVQLTCGGQAFATSLKAMVKANGLLRVDVHPQHGLLIQSESTAQSSINTRLLLPTEDFIHFIVNRTLGLVLPLGEFQPIVSIAEQMSCNLTICMNDAIHPILLQIPPVSGIEIEAVLMPVPAEQQTERSFLTASKSATVKEDGFCVLDSMSEFSEVEEFEAAQTQIPGTPPYAY